jgi:hypothetical protein
MANPESMIGDGENRKTAAQGRAADLGFAEQLLAEQEAAAALKKPEVASEGGKVEADKDGPMAKLFESQEKALQEKQEAEKAKLTKQIELCDAELAPTEASFKDIASAIEAGKGEAEEIAKKKETGEVLTGIEVVKLKVFVESQQQETKLSAKIDRLKKLKESLIVKLGENSTKH